MENFKKKLKLNMSLISFFLLIHIFELLQSIIILQFRRFLPIKDESNIKSLEEFINRRINNIFTTDIYLGEPPQLIPGFLKNHEHKFFLSNNYCPESEYYYKEKSKTFSYETPNNYLGIKISDSLIFHSDNNDVKIENFTINVDNDMKTPQCFHIGTQLLMKSDEKETNFIDILHKKKNIKSYFYKYTIKNDDELYLICDLDIDTNDNNYKFIKPLIMRFFPNSQFYQKWGLSFEYLKLLNNKYEYNDNINAEFDINYGCLLGTSDFKEKFQKFIKDNDIEIEKEYSERENYIFYFEKKNINKLKYFELEFYHRELDFNFTFFFEDLFLEKNNGFYFLIVFDYKTRTEWKFGFPFFKKYNFVFNHDSKIIGFNYKNINLDDDIDYKISEKENNKKSESNKDNINNKTNKKIILIVAGLIILIILVLFSGVFIGKKLFSIRKTKVNELLELYDYSSKKK